MKILGIEHIGIAVDSLDTSAPFWKKVLKIAHTHTETVAGQGVMTAVYDTGKGKIELLDSLGKDSPVGKFLEKRGPGIHHVCLEVDDIYKAIKELKENDIYIINEQPGVGAEGYLVIFIHPSSTGGVLVELVQKPE